MPNNKLIDKLSLISSDKTCSVKIDLYCPVKYTQFSAQLQGNITQWKINFSIDFGGDIVEREAFGDDALQAIFMASEGIRTTLHKKHHEWTDEQGVSDWMLFPMQIPIGWGRELYDDVVTEINNRVQKKNKDIEIQREKK